MSRLVKQVNSGAAQEDYSIGAQIIVPYTDPFNNTEYELPFNFGTFTAYGEGKLGLQAHYAVPSAAVYYGVSYDTTISDVRFCYPKNSYMYKWLNAYGTEHEITYTQYANKTGFLGCLPEDFTEVINTTKQFFENNNTVSSCKIFLLGAVNMSAFTGRLSQQAEILPILSDGENTVWEYWQNRIGQIQEISTSLISRVCYEIKNHSLSTQIILPDMYNGILHGEMDRVHTCFSADGFYDKTTCNSSNRVLPACVIG